MEKYTKTNDIKLIESCNDNIIEIIDPFDEVINNINNNVKTLIVKSKEFKKGFKKDIELPNLTSLFLSLNYNREEYLSDYTLETTKKLKEISFGYSWNPKKLFKLPKNIESVTFGGSFEDLCNFFDKTLPTTYKKLNKVFLGGSFNKDLTPTTNTFITINKNILTLKLSNKFDSKLDLTEMSKLEVIIFNTNYKRTDFKLPDSIIEINFGVEYNNDIDLSFFPVSLKKIILRKNYRSKIFSSVKKQFILDELDISKIDSGFPIYEFNLDNSIKVNKLIINENQLFILELYIEKKGIPKVIKNSYNLVILKNEQEILKIDSKDFSVFEELVSYESIKKDFYTPNKMLLDKIIKNVIDNDCLFSLIIKNKYYNVDSKFYDNQKEIIKNIHEKFNGEFSESYKYIREENRKVFNSKEFKPFSFFINSIYNVFINRRLRGFDLNDEKDESSLSIKEEEENDLMTFYLQEEILDALINRINKLFLTKVPRLKEPLIVRRSLSHDFFDKINLEEKKVPLIVTEKGLMSTSLYIHPGFSYNQRRKNPDASLKTIGWLMVLLIPPGIPVFDPLENYNNKMEKELLLPPNLEYEIVSIKRNYKIVNKEAYERIFLNKFTLWENEYKRRMEMDEKKLNDTLNIFFAVITKWNE